MQTRVETLGSTIRVRWHIAENGIGTTSASARTAIYFKRESDGRFYDFDDDTWQAVPTTAFTTLTEDTDLAGSYYYDLDTSGLIDEDTIICHATCGSSPTLTEEFAIQLQKPQDYFAHGAITLDYDTEIAHLGASLCGPSGLVEAATRAVFTVLNAATGAILLDAEQVTDNTNGVFSYSQSTLGLAAHTAYLLVVTVEYGTQSYRTVQPFTTL